jgi:2-hydroxychromene-2-carboxylate isomerase
MDVNGSGALEITLFFDFMCPFAYQTSLWLREVRDVIGVENVVVDWQFFSLVENSLGKERQGWHIWDQKIDNPEARGLSTFLVGAAVELKAGEDGLDRFYKVVGRMRHEQGKSIEDRQNLEAALTEAGFNPADFSAALDGTDTQAYQKLKESHTEAVEKYKVWGSSTIVFENEPGKALYLKIMPRPTGPQAFELFQFAQRMALGLPMIYEVKRVTTPEQEEQIKEQIKPTWA